MFYKLLFTTHVTHDTLCALAFSLKKYKQQRLRNKIEDDTEDSTIQDFKEKEIKLIKKSEEK